MENPIFILGPHKSGTTLLARLFDGHPDLFSIPFETHAFSLPQITWIDYTAYPSRPKNLSIQEIKDKFIENVINAKNENLIESKDYIGISQKKEIFKKSIFTDIINKDAHTVSELIMNYFDALKASSGNEDKSRIVEKSVEHHGATELIKRVYPTAKFVRILRNPYSNLVSFMKHVINVRLDNRPRGILKSILLGPNSWYPYIYRILHPLISSYQSMEKNAIAYPDDYMIIRYEDLVSQPELVMKEVSDHVDIEYNDDLLKPTMEGRLWKGNSTRDVKFEGISDKYVDKWKDDIDHIQIHFVNKFCDSILEKYEYETISPNRSLLVPRKTEWITTYLINRISYRLMD